MPQPKKVLFIDRDGTLIVEPPVDYQVDSLEKLRFVPGAITAMSRIATLGYELVMATNQDGLGRAMNCITTSKDFFQMRLGR